MIRKLNNKGIAIAEALLIIVMIIGVVGIGLYVFRQSKATNESASNGNSSNTVTSDQAPDIKKAADLRKTDAFLDNTNIDKQLDSSELDKALN